MMCDNNNFIEKLHIAFSECDLLLTDSREVALAVKSGKKVMFFALKGDKFDANIFIEDVIRDGASYVVTSRKDIGEKSSIFVFEDTLLALQQLANYHRRTLKAKVIVITGSNGKTTTKELLTATLSKKFKVSSTKGNLNNHIGVPLTLLSVKNDDDFAIVEHGANHLNEIATLCRISKPDYGIITNVGRAHLEGFGGEQGVIKAKGELYDNLQERGKIAFYNSSISVLANMVEARKNLLTKPYNNTIVNLLNEDTNSSGVKFKIGSYTVNTNLYGNYNIYNIAAVVAIGSYFGIEDEDIASAIGSYTPQNMRSQLINSSKNRIIVDAYNANPSSMIAAIDNFETSTSCHKNKIYILGQMNELGSYSQKEHETIAVKLQNIGAIAILIGPEFEQSSKKYNFEWFKSVDDAQNSGSIKKIKESTILLKGSRSIQIEKLLTEL